MISSPGINNFSEFLRMMPGCICEIFILRTFHRTFNAEFHNVDEVLADVDKLFLCLTNCFTAPGCGTEYKLGFSFM
jgi:hypothetical protein